MPVTPFKDIVDATLVNRFKEGDRPLAKRWVNAEYAWIWNQNDLAFKHVSALETTLAVTASDQTPSLPADFADLEELLDNLGEPLEPLAPDDFAARWRGVTATGVPCDYTIVNRTLYLGPAPATSATFYIGYRRLFSHFNAALDVVVGKMIEDDDAPLWPEEHYEVLIVGARIRGKINAQDSTWQSDQVKRDELLDSLLSDYGAATLTKPSYPIDPL